MRPSKRLRQNLGLLLGIVAGSTALAALTLPGQQSLHAHGPMNIGHEDMACEYCHQPARGTLRQQVQANARYLLGLRGSAADFGLRPVGNDQCLACHERPNERHPVFRFNEPRFQEARNVLHPESCISCHEEHRGVRITVDNTGYCRNCHEETRLKNDPVDVSHETLIASEEWETCLGCHDFHGNHVMEVDRRVGEAIPLERIQTYLDGGASPYAQERRYAAHKEPPP